MATDDCHTAHTRWPQCTYDGRPPFNSCGPPCTHEKWPHCTHKVAALHIRRMATTPSFRTLRQTPPIYQKGGCATQETYGGNAQRPCGHAAHIRWLHCTQNGWAHLAFPLLQNAPSIRQKAAPHTQGGRIAHSTYGNNSYISDDKTNTSRNKSRDGLHKRQMAVTPSLHVATLHT